MWSTSIIDFDVRKATPCLTENGKSLFLRKKVSPLTFVFLTQWKFWCVHKTCANYTHARTCTWHSLQTDPRLTSPPFAHRFFSFLPLFQTSLRGRRLKGKRRGAMIRPTRDAGTADAGKGRKIASFPSATLRAALSPHRLRGRVLFSASLPRF